MIGTFFFYFGVMCALMYVFATSLFCFKLFTRRGTEEVHVTPIISGSDFRIVLAPAISVEKNVTVKNSTVSENVLVCGWSLEFNVVTDVDFFLNKKQVFLVDLFKT